MTFKQKTLLSLLAFAIAALPSLVSSVASAETLYITDKWRFEVRESPCWECRIVRSLDTGTKLEVLESEEVEGWKNIRTESGIEGWISIRYISEQASAASQLEESLAVSKSAAIEREILREQFGILSTELLEAGIDVELIEISSEDGSVTVQAPRVIGNLATVGSQNQELLERNQILQNEIDLLSAQADRLSDSSWKSHFIYGCAAIFAGVILCLILTRLRPRKKYSEWA